MGANGGQQSEAILRRYIYMGLNVHINLLRLIRDGGKSEDGHLCPTNHTDCPTNQTDHQKR